MNPFALDAMAWQEPWRLWTGHLTHFGWGHGLANLIALAVPLLLTRRPDRARLMGCLLLIAPLLSLCLLPSIQGSEYRGASGLACALWSLAGLHLIRRRESAPVGLMLLGGLALKLGAESALGIGFIVHPEGWQTLSAAHGWGTALGLAFALPAWVHRLPTRGGARGIQRG